MSIKISEMSGKLKYIQAINTNPLTNEFCQQMNQNKNAICSECYSCRMLKGYRKNCTPAFEVNSNTISTTDISNDIPKLSKKNNIVRIHAHGELINELHLLNLIKIVEAYPSKIFSLYTKRTDLINKVFATSTKPQNLILVYSNPVIDTPLTDIPPKFDKVFNVCRNTNLDKINCGGRSCNTCRTCYTFGGTNIVYEMIK